MNRGCDAFGYRLRITGGAHRNPCLWPRALPEGHIYFRIIIVAQPVNPHVVEDPNNSPRDGSADPGLAWDQLIHGDGLREGIHTGHISAHEILVHHRDWCGRRGVLIGEAASAHNSNSVSCVIAW